MTDERKKAFIDFCKRDGFDISSDSSPQKRAVFDDVNIVPAGAGSGKTAVLSHRFLRLVMDGIHSDEILTITFTKAATANMKSRIYRLLRKAFEEGLIGFDEIERFPGAQIVTTDSLCSSIARLGCVRYGLPTDFAIEDSDSEEHISDQITMSVLSQFYGKPAFESLMRYRSTKQIRQIFCEIEEKYLDISQSNYPDPKEVSRLLLDDIRHKSETSRAYFINLCENYQQNFRDTQSSKKSVGQTYKDNYDILERLMKDVQDCTITPDVLRSSNISGRAKKGEKDVNNAMNEYALYLECLSDESISILSLWMNLVDAYRKKLILHKRQTGLLTFRDVMKIAIDILKTDKDIRNRFRNKYRSIMVDEFQDNNSDNRTLVYLLAATESYSGIKEPGIKDIEMSKVFMVGDQKQSIYRFRNADVSVFKAMSKDFGEGKTAELDMNYRSKPAIINSVNAIFSKVFAPQDGQTDTQDYEAQFSAQKFPKADETESGVFFMYLKSGSDETSDKTDGIFMSPSESEAYFVAEKIYEITEGNSGSCTINNGQKPHYSDIAILLRKGSNQGLFEKALQHFGIPFQVSESKSLLCDALVSDFFAIMHLAIYGTEDKLLLATYLGSPFCGFSESDLDDFFNIISGKQKARIDSCMENIEKLRTVMADGCIARDISFIWEDLGYRFFMLKNPDNKPYEEHFDYLFSLACDYDRRGLSVVDFLEFLRPYIGSSDGIKNLTILKEKADAVNIMTVHKSKGLEFPVVFFSDLSSGASPGGFRTNISQVSGCIILPFAVSGDKLVNPYMTKDTLMENAETKRILYVGATRAVNYLFFTGVIKGKNPQKTDGETTLTPMAFLLSALGYDGENFEDGVVSQCSEFFPREKSSMETPVTGKQTYCSADVSRWYETAYPLIDYQSNRTSVTMMESEYRADSTSLVPVFLPTVECDSILADSDDYVTMFGTYVHKMLEMAILKKDDSTFYGDFRYFEKREEIRRSAVSLRDGFLNSDFFVSLSDFRLECERKFCISDGEKTITGCIDLLCISEDKIVIVDYKTDRFRNDEYHLQQLGFYAKAVQSVYPGCKISAYLFYLRGSLAVKLISESEVTSTGRHNDMNIK